MKNQQKKLNLSIKLNFLFSYEVAKSGGLEAALLAPTAMNQQKFFFTRQDQNVHVKATGGFYSQMDLGIVKYHFELGAGKDQFHWI